MTDLLQRLGQRIRELRSQRGWSQEEFADVCGVHRTYMGHLERGEKNVSFNTIVKVATALDVRVAELFADLEVPLAAPGSRSRPVASPRRELDRQILAKELAILERAVRKLKDLAQPQESSARSAQPTSRRKGSSQ